MSCKASILLALDGTTGDCLHGRSGHDRIGFLAPGEMRVWGLGLTQANAVANAAGV